MSMASKTREDKVWISPELATPWATHNNYGSIVTNSPKKDNYRNKVFIAYITLLASMVLNVASIACVQVLGGAIPEFELNAWRFASQVVVTAPVIMYRRCDLRVVKHKLPMLFVMFFVYNFVNLMYFTAPIFLAGATFFGISTTVTITFNSCLSICIKSERKHPLYLGSVVAIFGLLLVTQPEFMFPGGILPPPPTTNFTYPCIPTQNGTYQEDISFTDKQWLGYTLAALSGIIISFEFHGLHNLMEHVNSFTFAFWNSLAGTIVSLIFMAGLEKPVLPTSATCILLLLGHAFGTSQVSVVLPWCLQYLSPTIAGLAYSSQLIVLLILQYTALKDIQPGHGNWVEILGAVLCFVGIIVGPTWVIYRENRTNSDRVIRHHK